MKHLSRSTPLALLVMLMIFSHAVLVAEPRSILLMWWNVENLFDTRDDPRTEDNEFTPQGQLHWTEKKLLLKRIRIGHVFKAVRADRAFSKYPDIVAFAETENREVFSSTLSAIDGIKYWTAYHESTDPRGIDIGLAWNPAAVSFTGSKPYTVPLGDRTTRQIIVAGFSIASHPFNVVLNHWPSRSFDTAWTEPRRIEAAKVARHIVDSLRARNPKADIIVMGDFNDDPQSVAMRDVLGSSLDRNMVLRQWNHLLYNCWNDTDFRGSYAYNKQWERIDNIMVSAGLFDRSGLSIDKGSFRCFFFPHMLDPSGKKLYSTYEKGKYKGGYSDHLPLLLRVSIAD